MKTALASQGIEWAQALRRDQALALADLPKPMHADLWLVDCSGEHQDQDMATLGAWMADQPHLSVIMLSTVLDPHTLVKAMQSGIREVLLTPVVPADLLAALQRFSKRKLALPKSIDKPPKVVSFMSCKGGSGATFLATNFADILAKDFEKKTIFLDLDLHYGDAAYYVSQGPNQSDITELTRQINRLDAQLLASSVLHIGPHFDLLSAPEDPAANDAISGDQLASLMAVVQANYDMVVLDVDRVLDPLAIKALDMSDVIYLVMENLLPFVRDAKRLVAKFKALGFSEKKIRVVVNRYEKNSTIDIAQFEKALGIQVSYTIRSNFADAAQAINTGVPITDVNTNSPIVRVLRDMAQSFDTQPAYKSHSWFDRLVNKVT